MLLSTLQEMHQWFRTIFESSSDPAWLIDGNHFVDCNDAAVRILGYPNRSALLNQHPSALSPKVQPDGEQSHEKAERLIAETLKKGLNRFEWIHLRADGTQFLAEVTLSTIQIQQHVMLFCHWRDISSDKQRDQQLRELLEEQRLIFDNAQVGILLLQNRRILKCNQYIADMFGYASPAELIGERTAAFYISNEHFEEIGRIGYNQLAEKGVASFESSMRRRDGTPMWIIQYGRALNPADVLNSTSLWVYSDITERKLADLALQHSEEKFAQAFDSCPLAASISNIEDGRFIEVNASYERNFGWSRNDLVGKTSLEIGFWPDTETREAWLQAIYAAGSLVDYESVWIHKNGERRNVNLSCDIIELDGHACILTYLTDITNRKIAEADLRVAATAFESQESMIVTDADGIILRVNLAFTESTGYSAKEVIGQTPKILNSGRHPPSFYREMWESILNTGTWQGEIWDRRKNGEIYPKWLTISAVKNETGETTHYVGTHFDITERKLAEEKINALAFYDQLTNLPNRTLLLDRLNQSMATSARKTEYGALLFIDLDNFKTLNDTQGHEIGDQLLKETAKRLRETIREEDTAARLGGDEFVVVLSGLGTMETDAASAAEVVGGKILAELSQPYRIGGITHRCSASIGIVLFLGHNASADELMKQADLAMYKAKDSGRHAVRFFDPDMEAAVLAQASMERDLRTALDEEQFILHLQPQVLSDNTIIGAEALVRWMHPERGMVPPGQFIPLAEETDLILPLGLWVLRTACRTLANWSQQSELATLTISVNVSAKQFHQADFVNQVLEVIDETGANPQRLKLELTESMLAEDVENIIRKMYRLKHVGIGFSLDDFGTGYSSLSYLKQLPIDQLKIDQSFVRDVLSDPNDAAIARTIVALAQSLGLNVIAEGVETEAQKHFLAANDCHAYQGYYFSRPLPLADFEGHVLNNLRLTMHA
jgi:diguanylate cyclase (GGDEF)-like protein/PAS domain S-box-containing protein